MAVENHRERVGTLIVGAGQAGLSAGYYLARRGLPFLIVEAHQRVGDAWRERWDSLRLFTPARYDGLAGFPFPAAGFSFPTKDEMADYLESYVERFRLPVRTGVRIERLAREGPTFVASAGAQTFEADNVIVAMASFQQPLVPAFARDLDPRIIQLHSLEYRRPAQLRQGSVLVVGAGNSGSEIALELARTHRVWMSGRDVGHVPFRIEGTAAKLFVPIVFRVLFHRVFTTSTPIGRRLRPKVLYAGGPLIRVKPADLAAAGVERVPRVAGTRAGMPVLDDGRVLDVENVIWCTGFNPGFSWIDLPVFDDRGYPMQRRGIVERERGLYFTGLHFLYALSSTMIHGASRDAAYVVRHLARHPRPGPDRRQA